MSTTQSSGAGRADAPPVEGAELDAVISYARDALELRIDGIAGIDRLLGDLARAGKRAWLDRSDIEPAADRRGRLWDPARRAEIGQPIDPRHVVALAGGGQLGCDLNGSLAFAADLPARSYSPICGRG